jgi:ubiquinone biosynthesis protein UbiJ
LDSQEEFLIKENKKHVKVKNAYAQEVEKNENLTKELSICYDTISILRTENASLIAKVEKLNACKDSIVSLRNENASLIAKIDKLNESIPSLKTENDKLISKAKDLNVCNDSISCLRDENAMLKSKIDELNVCKPSTSTIEHISICTRCRDVNVDAINDHLALIKQQNEHIATLTAKINEHEIEKENFKFARSMLYSGRRSGIKDGIGFQKGDNVKLNAPKKLSNFVKGKAPMVQDNEGYILYPAGYPEHKIRRIHSRKSHSGSHHAFIYKSKASSSRQSTQQGSNVKLNTPKRLSNFVKSKAPMVQDNEGYILYPENYPEHRIRRIHARKPHTISHHAFMYKNEASSSRQSTHVKLPKKKTHVASNEPIISFKTFDASYVLTKKSGKIVAKYVGAKHKGSKTCVWVPKVLVSNVKGPKTVWVPKNKA